MPDAVASEALPLVQTVGLVRYSYHLNPAGNHYMAALRAFFDDSKRNAVAFTGYVGTVDQWKVFEGKWTDLLSRHHIPYFHMNEFTISVGPFAGWKDDEDRRRYLVDDICSVVSGIGVKYVSATVDLSGLRAAGDRRGESVEALPFAIAMCMRELHGLLWKPGQPFPEIECICDKMKDAHAVLAKAEQYIFRDGEDIANWWREGNVIITPLKKDESWKRGDARPIQLSDFLAWESRNGSEISLGYKQSGGHWAGDRESAVKIAQASSGNSRMYDQRAIDQWPGFGDNVSHGAPYMNPTQETVYLSENGVRVTSTRFIVKGETYAMSGITSIRTEVKESSKVAPWLTILIGVLILSQKNTGVLGPLIAIVGFFWLRSAVTEYTVSLTSASGEKTPYKSTDKAFVEKIVAAINEAIIQRG